MQKIIFCCVFLCLLATPLAESFLRILPRTEIAGVQNGFLRPIFHKADFKTDTYQKNFERWLQLNNGFWGWFIRFENEIDARLFNQVSSDYKTSVQLGNDGYFFQPMYLGAFNRNKRPPVSLIQSKIKNVGVLGDLLKARGVPVVMLMSPNLISLYPELLPQRYVDPTRLTRGASYEIGKSAIKKFSVPAIDAFEMLQGKAASVPYRFFEPTGSHWNEIGSCLGTAEVVGKINELSGKGLNVPTCDNITWENPPPDANIDLIKIANLLDPERYYRPAPVVHPGPPNGNEAKNILLVGTSFLFALEEQLLKHKVTSNTELLFYYRERRINGNSKSSRVLDKASIDWERILSADAIILEVNHSGPGQIGFGFVEDAIRYLKKKSK